MLTQEEEEEGVWELIMMQERDRCPINIHCSLHFFPTFTLLSLSTMFFIVNYEFFQHYLPHRTDSLHWEIRLNTKTSFFFFFSQKFMGKHAHELLKQLLKKKQNRTNNKININFSKVSRFVWFCGTQFTRTNAVVPHIIFSFISTFICFQPTKINTV